MTAMTCLGLPKVETLYTLDEDNLSEAEMWQEDMIRVLPVLLRLIVTDPMPHPSI